VAPAVTTAGDRRFGVALDDPPPGWRLANRQDHKAFAAALLSGARVRLDGAADWLEASGLPFAGEAGLAIHATERAVAGSEQALVYHPAVLALGVGCERGTAPEEGLELVRGTLAEHGLAEGALAGVFSIDLKADEPALHAVAEALGVPARVFDAATLEAETPRLANPSDLVFREVGCHGVAEGAALAAAGPEGELVVPKVKWVRATCALARAPRPILEAGRPRGSLAVVGLGPGAPDWRTPEAAEALRSASDLVGYRLYLDLLGPAVADQARHAYELARAARSRWSVRAIRGSMPWRRWSSSFWSERGGRTGGVWRSRSCPASRPCRPPPRGSARRSAMTSAPCRSRTC
jgi:cobalt-precorrin 5A hydrolase/precorrin-3B C17-methyltransferase